MYIFDPNDSIEAFRESENPTREQITQWFEDVLPYAEQGMEDLEVRTVVYMARLLNRLPEAIEAMAISAISEATIKPLSIWDDSEFDHDRATSHAHWLLSTNQMPMDTNDVYATLQLVSNKINELIEY